MSANPKSSTAVFDTLIAEGLVPGTGDFEAAYEALIPPIHPYIPVVNEFWQAGRLGGYPSTHNRNKIFEALTVFHDCIHSDKWMLTCEEATELHKALFTIQIAACREDLWDPTVTNQIEVLQALEPHAECCGKRLANSEEFYAEFCRKE